MFPKDYSPAPDEVLKMISCKCSTDMPCSRKNCSCSVAQLACSEFCACSDKCCHNKWSMMRGDNDTDDEDENESEDEDII